MSLENRRKKEEQRSSRGGRNDRGFRGRGRGGRGRGGRQDEYESHESTTQGGHDASPDEKLAMVLDYLSEFIKTKLDQKQLEGEYKYPRNQLYQMYFVMSRLDAAKFCKLDFIVNFGVSMENKAKISNMIEVGATKAKFN